MFSAAYYLTVIKMTDRIKIIKNTAVTLLVTAAIYFCLGFPREIGESVQNSTGRCLDIIIPSMFIFMCITTFISMSGLHSLLGMPFKIISEKLFRLPKEGFAVFLLSLISGYPAGIKLVKDCCNSGGITSEQKRILGYICCCGGPAFISGTAAQYLYPDSNAAVLIFTSIISANILTAFFLTRCLPKIKKSPKRRTETDIKTLIPAVRSASSAMMQMCIMIVAFGGLLQMLKLSGGIEAIALPVSRTLDISAETVSAVIMSFLEISNIVTLPCMNEALFPAVTFLLSFGGVCVMMQIAALADKDLPIVRFIAARLCTALEAGVISRLLLPLLTLPKADIPCSADFHAVTPTPHHAFAAAMLVVMMGMMIKKEKNY